MAKNYNPGLRGKLRNDIYARNRGGEYVKNINSMPYTDYETAAQAGRSLLFQSVELEWAAAAQSERDTWIAAAAGTSLTPKQLFMRLNLPLMFYGGGIPNVNYPGLLRPTGITNLTLIASTSQLIISFSPALSAQSALIITFSTPQSQTINYFTKLLKICTTYGGTSPFDAFTVYTSNIFPTINSGDKIFCGVKTMHTTSGYMSPVITTFAIAT